MPQRPVSSERVCSGRRFDRQSSGERSDRFFNIHVASDIIQQLNNHKTKKVKKDTEEEKSAKKKKTKTKKGFGEVPMFSDEEVSADDDADSEWSQ